MADSKGAGNGRALGAVCRFRNLCGCGIFTQPSRRSRMAEIKTKATEVAVPDFIAALPDPVRRADAEALLAMYERLTGEPPKMWGPTIIGFGSYRYQYESGH